MESTTSIIVVAFGKLTTSKESSPSSVLINMGDGNSEAKVDLPIP